MRTAKTILDISELLSDYEVTILLTDNCSVEFLFPTTEEEIKEIKENQDRVNCMYGNYNNCDDFIGMSRKTRYRIRSLVGNPRFWRLTTVASQLGSFRISNNKNDIKEFGIIREKKRKNENLQIVFQNQKYAKIFFKKLYKSGFFKKDKMLLS